MNDNVKQKQNEPQITGDSSNMSELNHLSDDTEIAETDEHPNAESSLNLNPINTVQIARDAEEIQIAFFQRNSLKEIRQKKFSRDHPDQDRGWAWVVFVATFLGRMVLLGTLLTFNIYFTLFLEVFHETRGFTSLIGSILWASYDSTAIISGYIVNRFGPRITTIIGGCMMATSLALSSFVSSVHYLMFTMGFVVGLGTQFVSMGCVQALRIYFRHYANFVQGVSTAGAGIGMLVLGRILPVILEIYDWRGTFALHGALLFNLILVGAIMFPIRPYTNSKKLDQDLTESQQTTRTATSIKLLKDWKFWCLLLSYFLFGFSYVIVTVLLNDYIDSRGLGSYMPLAHSLFAIGDIFGRVGSGVTSYLRVVPILMFIFTHFFQAVLQFSFISVTKYWELYVCSFLYGAVTGCANGLFFVVPCDLFQSDDFLVAFPYLSTTAGFGNLIGAPIAGSLIDITGTYTAALLLGGFSEFLAAVLLLPIYIERRRKQSQKENHDN